MDQLKEKETMDYANINEVKEGDKLIADGGFTSLKAGDVREIIRTKDGDLAIHCSGPGGINTFDGQVDHERGGEVIGLAKEQT